MDDYYDYYDFDDYDSPDVFETNPEDCIREVRDYYAPDLIKTIKNVYNEFAHDTLLEDCTLVDINTDKSILPKYLTITITVKSSNGKTYSDDYEIEFFNYEFEGHDWNKYYPATRWEPAEGGYYEYVELDYNQEALIREANYILDDLLYDIANDAEG